MFDKIGLRLSNYSHSSRKMVTNFSYQCNQEFHFEELKFGKKLTNENFTEEEKVRKSEYCFKKLVDDLATNNL